MIVDARSVLVTIHKIFSVNKPTNTSKNITSLDRCDGYMVQPSLQLTTAMAEQI